MSFWQEYKQINEELEDIKRMIIENTQNKYLEGIIEPMVYSSGKMLRPAFVLLSGKFGEVDPEKLKRLAMIVELLHIATLIHDDIIDDANMRRGEASIQAKKGKNAAVFIGDFYLCQCFLLLSNEYDQVELQEIAKVINTICLAEIQQNYNKDNKDMNVRNYLKVISGKTAALFSLSFYMGAKISNCDEKLCNVLGKIGKYIGMAFQIIDDILDYSTDKIALGKENNKDIQQGYYTLPLIYALANDTGFELKEILNKTKLNSEDYNNILRKVEENKGLEYSKKLANAYTNKAFTLINDLPDSESKEILANVTAKLLKRKY